MRYIDTGGRDPNDALGSWLTAELVQPQDIQAVRWQSGFFGSGVLGLFEPTFASLAGRGGVVRLLVGSNDGGTQRADVDALLAAVGAPRADLDVAVVSFQNCYFHPKTVHIDRCDGSSAAYVGSANLTLSGVGGLHVEAGTLLDTNSDDPAVLAAVAAAVDWWFLARPPGLYYMKDSTDVDGLVKAGLLNVPAPPRPSTGTGGASSATGHRLQPLLSLPPTQSKSSPAAAAAASPASTPVSAPAVPPVPSAVVTAAPQGVSWSKSLTRSDAQRKASGHQRGAITLVSRGSGVDTATWFRFDLFGAVSWATGQKTRTGEPLETAVVPMDVTVDGRSLGIRNMLLTYASNREKGQNNYTTLLHVGALRSEFSGNDLTGKDLTLSRSSAGSYGLTIA